ncbi:MAG TPA: metallophosphoesterase family protein [Labilithrix sp.]|jgi:putative phosphoesterase|nr:metallophosphoesterase family protein [Labilithrix sp.]
MAAPKLSLGEQTLQLREGRLRVVVVADSHSAPHPASGELIAETRPDHILHAGDIGDLAVLDDLRRIAPVSAVRGNIDVHGADLPDVLAIDVRDGTSSSGSAKDESLLKIVLLHIGVNGTKLRADAAKLARQQGARLVVCGHSHVPFIGRDRDLGIFNPGSFGPRRFHLPIVFGLMDVTSSRVDLRHIDCATGQPWLP